MRRDAALGVTVLTMAALAGCVDLAPSHRSPALPIPADWRERGAAEQDAVALPLDASWQDFVVDERLRRVVDRALADNRTLRIAVLDIERARATYRVSRSARFPVVNATTGATRARSDGITFNDYIAQVDASYEIDLFGRVRNANAAALASFFATRASRWSVRLSLIAEVATTWLTLAADRERLALAERTLGSQRSSLDLTRKAHDLGKFTGLDVAQVQSTVESARLAVANLRTQIALDRDALELVVGGAVREDDLPQALPITNTALFDVPANLPSSVLVRRPDVEASERQLAAASANIGVARAAFFPVIRLTGNAGVETSALGRLVGGSAVSWAFGPSIELPLFDGGARSANLALSKADRDIAVANYERTVQTAFREVADVLAARRTLDERVSAQAAFADSVGTSQRLAEAVFRQGRTDYLSVLTAQQSSFDAQQALIGLRLEEQTTRIALYKVLGGAWRRDDGQDRGGPE